MLSNAEWQLVLVHNVRFEICDTLDWTVADADRTLLNAWEHSSAQLAEVSLRATEALYFGTSGGAVTRPSNNEATAFATAVSPTTQEYQVDVISPTGVWRRCTIVATVRPPEHPEEAVIVRYEGNPAQDNEIIAAREWPGRLRIPVAH